MGTTPKGKIRGRSVYKYFKRRMHKITSRAAAEAERAVCRCKGRIRRIPRMFVKLCLYCRRMYPHIPSISTFRVSQPTTNPVRPARRKRRWRSRWGSRKTCPEKQHTVVENEDTRRRCTPRQARDWIGIDIRENRTVVGKHCQAGTRVIRESSILISQDISVTSHSEGEI